MKWKEWLDEWSMTSLRVKASFLEMEWKPRDADKAAAWEMYVELLTRSTTQYLRPEQGDEATALRSIHRLFEITRDVLRRNGRTCGEFAKIAVVVLNQVIRPFTTRWHRLSLGGAFGDSRQCGLFREELSVLQDRLRTYTMMLAQMADIEEPGDFEDRDL